MPKFAILSTISLNDFVRKIKNNKKIKKKYKNMYTERQIEHGTRGGLEPRSSVYVLLCTLILKLDNNKCLKYL